jgi:hypothetical protein
MKKMGQHKVSGVRIVHLLLQKKICMGFAFSEHHSELPFLFSD